MNHFSLMVSTLLLTLLSPVNGEMSDTELKQNILSVMGQGHMNANPTAHIVDKHLFLAVKIHDISEVNEKDNKFTAEITISLTW